MMTPSQLHTHLHHEAYADIEDRLRARTARPTAPTRSVSVERAKKVRAMLERVDHLRAGKPVDVSGFSRRPQEGLDTLKEAGQMPLEAYAREMRRADAAEATFARRTRLGATDAAPGRQEAQVALLPRPRAEDQIGESHGHGAHAAHSCLSSGAPRRTLARVASAYPRRVRPIFPAPRAAAFRGDESYRAAARGRASGREAVRPHGHPLETSQRRLRVPHGRRRRDAQAQLRDLAHGPSRRRTPSPGVEATIRW